ncbi:HPC2-domain-containing protein [Coniochaeta hoffmannii]|uniref:HPC2-domain-containing protein n=1 Tax=Coniochaeta hoffmannii TaxID=91930 RepID=A0AA38RAP4_9PEZI|nr:HPC2-domain-containing protein [Coniochaeta hoffmannii]
MDTANRDSSSPTSLSSPPSAISEPVSPTRFIRQGRANIEMDEIVVDPGSAARFGVLPSQQPPAPTVQLTAAGLPRKKPGRKPGTTVKPKVNPDGTVPEIKRRRPRKPKDPDAPEAPDAPPAQRRKRKAPANDADSMPAQENRPFPGAASAASRQPKITELTSMRMDLDPRPTPPTITASPGAEQQQSYGLKMPKREGVPGSMLSLLNDEEPPRRPSSVPQPPPPPPPARQIFDPVRGNYDPVRETMISRDPYGTGPLGSPRAPTSSSHVVNRASASPSIASLVDPSPSAQHIASPVQSQHPYGKPSANGSASMPPRFHETTSMPPSPSQPAKSAQQQPPAKPAKPSILEVKRVPPPTPPTPAEPKKAEPPLNSFTSMSSIPASAKLSATTTAPAQSKKVAAVAQQDREKNKASSSSSSPNITSLKDSLPPLPSGNGRSILDFGKANPGEENQVPSIVLHIPLSGESNKVVNFMRMAEERYGWDALHPRLAAHRDRKARIAAASAALEKNGSGRESGDEMSVDLGSDAEKSGDEMEGVVVGGPGGTSGPDGAPAKPARKKRTNKEDEYDKDDDFVDDSELLWEEQAAASRDGFFVYSGPLIPEVEKPPAGEAPARRGRGGGRGSRGGGRGGTRGGGEGTGRGRGGGPGSRGGSVTRKPRITKLEKEQRDKEKAEREKLAQTTSKTATNTSPYSLLQLGQGPATGIA